MKRVKLLKRGLAFILLGTVFLIIPSSMCKAIGGFEFFIGAVTCSIYNFEKFKFYKALRQEARKSLYQFPLRPIVSCILCLCFLFLSTSFVWGYLMYENIVSPIVFHIVGVVYWVLLIPCIWSWQIDECDRKIIMSIIQQLEERYGKRT